MASTAKNKESYPSHRKPSIFEKLTDTNTYNYANVVSYPFLVAVSDVKLGYELVDKWKDA